MIRGARTYGRSVGALILAVAALTGGAAGAGAATAGALATRLQGSPLRSVGTLNVATGAPTDAQCRAALGVPCYSPQEIRRAYGLRNLLSDGYQGRGQSIVIVDAYGSPTVARDLARFDADFGLPAPASFTQLAPLGSVKFDPTNATMVGWAEETSLDVQWAHALAPKASIVLLTSPVNETQGVTGLPQFLALEKYAVAHHLGNIISQSWGTTENTLFTKAGKAVIAQFDAFYRSATLHGITFLTGAGDAGSANPDAAGNVYPFPTVSFPASSPWVTTVGGTSLKASTSGRYLGETVWNNTLDGGATGGGVSRYEPEPLYQRSLPAADQKLLAGHRAIPDLAFNADQDSGVLVHLGFLGAAANGYYIFGGTSEGSPAWAGIVADLNQRAGFALGFLNPTLYALGASHLLYSTTLFRDVTVGNNAQPPVRGYRAGPGWDAVTGWGTPNLALLGSSMIAQARQGVPAAYSK